MRRLITIIIVVGIMGPSGLLAVQYSQEYSSSHALVIGIDRYQHWPHLEYAAKDAMGVNDVLTARGFQTYVLIDEKATRVNILRKLDAIKKLADQNSRVLIYFAGHGQTEDLPGGRERGYIVPVDADTHNWQDTMLAMNRLNQRIRQIRAKHILLAFDACYSGLGLMRSIKRHPEQDSTYIHKMMRSRSIQILTAGSRSEQAIEAEGHGLFTEHLLVALSGAADINSDGFITGTEIYATVRPGVTQASHSRQTPQFGYIEGNGDTIFYNNMPRDVRRSTLLIHSRISRIDVWAGSTKIAHRLPAGRHRLAVNAGKTILMVKKGSQTLYHKHVVLRANREFRIQLSGKTRISNKRRPFSMLTINHPEIENYSNSIAHDLDGDGREEIITASDNRLYALKPDGTIYWQRKFAFPIRLNLIDQWHNQTAIGISAIKAEKIHLILLNNFGKIIWRTHAKTALNQQGRSSAQGKIARLADIDLDGYEDIIAIMPAGSGLKPHRLFVYDRHGNDLWRYAIGPRPQNIVVWPKETERPDILIGTYNPGNGNPVIHDKTAGRQAYIISVDGYGKTNWIIPTGTYYTGVGVLLSELKADGTRNLYANKYTSYNYRDDEGGIYRISRSGSILYRFETGNSILNIIVDGSGSRDGTYVYAVDSKSNLLKLDNRLNLVQKKRLDGNPGKQEMRLVGIHDYDGNGVDDVLLYSFNRLLFAKNPLAEAKPARRRFYSNLKFQVLSQDFSRLIKTVSLGEKWGKRGGFTVKDFDRPESAPYAFMTLSDKITIYNY